MAKPNDNLRSTCSRSQFTKYPFFNFAETAIDHFQGLNDNSWRSREEAPSSYLPQPFLERSLRCLKLADKEASRGKPRRRRHLSFRACPDVLQAKPVLRYADINGIRKCAHIIPRRPQASCKGGEPGLPLPFDEAEAVTECRGPVLRILDDAEVISSPNQGSAPLQEAGNRPIDNLRVRDGTHVPKPFELDHLHPGECPCQQPGNAEG